MNIKFGMIALIVFTLSPIGVWGKEAEPRADGIYVKATTSQGGAIDVALTSARSPMEQSRSKTEFVRRFPLGSSLAVLAQGSHREVVSLVIEVTKNGKQTSHVSASGDHVTGTVLQNDPRVSAFEDRPPN